MRSMVFKSSYLLFFALLFALFPSPSYATACPFSWNTNLKAGMTSTDVAKLQDYLGVSPASGWFSPLTKKAVTAFQEQYAADILTPNALTKGNGYVGPSTRAKLNALCGTVLGASIQTAPTPLLTIVPGDQPPHLLAPQDALYVPFTTVTFTAGAEDVNISSVTIQRMGIGSDAAFYDIGLMDPDDVEFSYGYLNSLHQVTLRDTFTIPAGTSQTYTIVGDMNADLSGNVGEMPTLALVAVNASAPVTASLPIVGTAQTINSTLAIGSATAIVAGDDPRVDRTRYINDTGITFSSVRVTAGSQENLTLTSVNWEQTGSAAVSDITNVMTVVGGVAYPTETDGRYYWSDFPDGIPLPKGASTDISVRGDLTTTGSNRTVKFDLHYGSDIVLYGTMYGFGINVYPADNTDTSGNSVFLTSDGTTDGDALTPYFSGSQVTISPGAITNIGKQ